jgi:hypothetical protein
VQRPSRKTGAKDRTRHVGIRRELCTGRVPSGKAAYRRAINTHLSRRTPQGSQNAGLFYAAEHSHAGGGLVPFHTFAKDRHAFCGGTQGRLCLSQRLMPAATVDACCNGRYLPQQSMPAATVDACCNGRYLPQRLMPVATIDACRND